MLEVVDDKLLSPTQGSIQSISKDSERNCLYLVQNIIYYKSLPSTFGIDAGNDASRISKFKLDTETIERSIYYHRPFVSSAVDLFNDFGYFVSIENYLDTNNVIVDTPAKVTKVNLTNFSVSESVELGPNDFDPLSRTAIYGNYLWIARDNYLIQFDLLTFSKINEYQITSLTSIRDLAFDTINGFVYLINSGSPLKLVKFNLNNYTFSDITLIPGIAGTLGALDINTTTNKAYIGIRKTTITPSLPAQIIKVDLNTFTQESTINFNITNKTSIISLLIDSTNNELYYTTTSGNLLSEFLDNALFVKIDLDTETIIDYIFPEGTASGSKMLSISHENEKTYVGFSAGSLSIGTGVLNVYDRNSFEFNKSITFHQGTNSILGITRDEDFLYLIGTGSTVTKFDQITFGERETASFFSSGFCSGVSSFAREDNFIYINNSGVALALQNNAKIIKLNFPELELIDEIFLPSLSPNRTIFAIDGLLFAPTYDNTSTVYKIDQSDMSVLDSVNLLSDEDNVSLITKGNEDEFLYMVTDSSPVKIIKFNWQTFTRVSRIILNTGENLNGSFSTSPTIANFVDPITNLMYLGVDTNRIVVIDLNTFTRLTHISLPTNFKCTNMFNDIRNRNGYFVIENTSTLETRLLKIDLETYTTIESLTLPFTEVSASFYDEVCGRAYFCTFTGPTTIFTVNIDSLANIQYQKVQNVCDDLQNQFRCACINQGNAGLRCLTAVYARPQCNFTDIRNNVCSNRIVNLTPALIPAITVCNLNLASTANCNLSFKTSTGRDRCR